MGRKQRAPPMIPEQDRRICLGICICQLIAILSCVSIVYLSVVIYLPAYREFNSGYNIEPAVCQTVETIIGGNCNKVACGEWCLSKSSNPCTEIKVIVRNNGSALRLENCTKTGGLQSVSCPQAHEELLPKYNCNDDEECKTITGLFICQRGHCANLSEIYNCLPVADGITIDADKDNLKLNGFFQCNRSRCTQIRKTPFHCDRICKPVSTVGGTGIKINVLLLHGDNVEAATCSKAVRINNASGIVYNNNITKEMTQEEETLIWTPEKGILMAACIKAERNPTTGIIMAEDCINGTTVPHGQLPEPSMNFTTLWTLFEEAQTTRNDDLLPPPQRDLEKFPGNTSWLFINLEGCVNTLKGECLDFIEKHGRDGSNHTGESRFPCFYHKNNSGLVVARYDLNRTQLELMFFAGIPGVLAVISCFTLGCCVRTVKVGDDAKMRCNLRRCFCCCSGNTDHKRKNEAD